MISLARATAMLLAGILSTALLGSCATMQPPALAAAAEPALQDFSLDFVVIYRADDPDMALRPAGIAGVAYNVPTWRAFDPARADLVETQRSAESRGDGFDDRILAGDAARRSASYFNAGEAIRVSPARVERRGDVLHAIYPSDPRFTLTARVELAAESYPLVSWSLTASKAGYFSVGYQGAPKLAFEEVSELWQPLIWQERRMPDRSYLTLAYRAPLPTAMVRSGEDAYAAIAHPDEFPFQPLPLAENSRFGISVRTPEGRASPMIFAPVLGGLNSRLEAGEGTAFKFYLVKEKARDLTRLYEKLAVQLYGFRDYRRNAIASLNTTFDNITDYSMSEYARWIDALKGSSYSTDVPGAVKNVSSLNPLMLAIVTDRREMFEDRVVPYVEYMLSREKFLFSLDPAQKIQSPSRALRGPVAPISELAALHAILGKRNPGLLDLARSEFEGSRVRNLDVPESGRTWANALALYEATGDRKMLEFARNGGEQYLEQRVERMRMGFEKDPFFFWPAFVPDFVDLYRLFEATQDRRFLEAAQGGARRYAMFIWMAPRIPDADVTVNPGGRAPMYWYLESKGHRPMTAPEAKVPAWRLSEIGLTAESSGTSSGHRAIFMANYAPWMLRIGEDAGDGYLQAIARSAIIGRYRNFPGYHINTARTTIYEAADYPLRDHKDLSVNSFHYNHIWPMAAMLLDYLVSDAHVRSNGEIEFPSQFIEGYAYLQNKFYGHRPGRFHGEEGVHLWMPKGLVRMDTLELNYIAGYRGDSLYLAFANQSDAPVRARFTLSPEAVQGIGPTRVQRLSDAGSAAVEGGPFVIEVPAGGQTAIRIDGVRAKSGFQRGLLATTSPVVNDTAALDIGDARAVLLDFGTLGRRFYVYLREDDSKFRNATLHYRDSDGRWRAVVDSAFPFEFSVRVGQGKPFSFRLSGERVDGSRVQSKDVTLGLH